MKTDAALTFSSHPLCYHGGSTGSALLRDALAWALK